MKLAILGFGREGKSLLKFLQKRGQTQKGTRTDAEKIPRRSASNEIWVLDKNGEIKIPKGVQKQTGKSYLKNLEQFNIIFRSPGVPYMLPEIQKARKAGVEISSSTKLFLDIINQKPETRNQKPVIIGITGTKGKSTTSTLLYQILKAHRLGSGQAVRSDSLQAAGKDVYLAGNVGAPMLDILPRNSAFVILELSSFQLQGLDASPPIAVVLTVFPDHLGAHKSLKEYYGAKTAIARYQKPNDKIFFFKNETRSRWIAQKSRGKKIGVNEKNFKLFSPKDLLIKGEHNFKNAVMAAAVAKSLGVPNRIILKVIRKFPGLKHRLELVRVIRAPRGLTQKSTRTNAEKIPRKSALNQRWSAIYFYNDSAAHNPGATIAALKTIAGSTRPVPSRVEGLTTGGSTQLPRQNSGQVAAGKNIILIAGGKERGLDYAGLGKIVKRYAKSVILIGENKKALAKAIRMSPPKNGIEIQFANTVPAAVRLAHKIAKPGCSVLFSPASASFDMFRNYEERGEIFAKEVRRLKQ